MDINIPGSSNGSEKSKPKTTPKSKQKTQTKKEPRNAPGTSDARVEELDKLLNEEEPKAPVLSRPGNTWQSYVLGAVLTVLVLAAAILIPSTLSRNNATQNIQSIDDLRTGSKRISDRVQYLKTKSELQDRLFAARNQWVAALMRNDSSEALQAASWTLQVLDALASHKLEHASLLEAHPDPKEMSFELRATSEAKQLLEQGAREGHHLNYLFEFTGRRDAIDAVRSSWVVAAKRHDIEGRRAAARKLLELKNELVAFQNDHPQYAHLLHHRSSPQAPNTLDKQMQQLVQISGTPVRSKRMAGEKMADFIQRVRREARDRMKQRHVAQANRVQQGG